jgi:hypothetical protein
MAGDLNAKHVDWNSRLTTRRGKLLRDYADGNSCLIFGPDTPTTNPYNPSATPDILDIAVTKDLPFPVYLTSCSALSSDTSRYSFTQRVAHPFITHRTDPISGALIGSTSRHTWKIKFLSIRNCTMGWQSTLSLRTSPALSCRLWQHLLPRVAHVTTHGL